MRLIALRFQGIGPYKGEFAIDFTALASSHMFLIEGETGAGKTTILDAIVYALYGETSVGDGKDGKSSKDRKGRMRSRFLYDSPTDSWVDLVFESNGAYYRVRREPEYDRPKKRGTGTTPHNAKGTLWKLADGMAELVAQGTSREGGDAERFFDFAEQPEAAETLAGKAGEVGVDVTRIVGLNRDQFSKTIMLAQGEFSRFLQMKPEDRTKLLRDLFGAKVYEDIQQDLHDRCVQARKALDKERADLVSLIGTARENADIIGVATEDADWGLAADGNGRIDLDEPALDADQIADRIGHTLEQVRQASEAAGQGGDRERERLAQAAAKAKERQSAIDGLRQTADIERDHALRLHGLEGERDRIDRIEARLERSRLAEPVAAKHHELEHARDAVDATTGELDAARTALDGFEPRAELAERHAQALRASQDEAAAMAGMDVVRAHRRQLNDMEARRQDARLAAATLGQATQAVETAERKLRDLGDAAELESRRQEVATLLGGRGQRAERVEQARHALDEVNRRDALAGRLDQAKADHAVAQEAAREAHAKATRARALLDQAGAAKYAAGLREGEPCPVCGATEHPAPATPPDDIPAPALIEAYETQAEERDAAERDAAAAVTKLDAQCAELAERTGGLGAQDAATALEQAKASLAELDTLEAEADALGRRHDAIEQAQSALADARQRLAAARQGDEAARKALMDATEATEGRTEETVDAEEQSLNARIDKAKAQARLASELEERIGRLDRAQRQVTELEATLAAQRGQMATLEDAERRLCKEQGFDDARQAMAAALGPDETGELLVQTQRWHADMADAQAALRQARKSLATLLGGSVARELLGGTLDMQAHGGQDHGTRTDGPIAHGDDGTPTALGEAIAALDADEAARQARQAQERADEAATMLGRIQSAEEERARRADLLKDRLAAWRASMEAFVPLETMDAMASGAIPTTDGRKITLVTYAVTERFRDVLDQTNDILRDIHGGVYELRLADHEGRGGTRTGLPIEVIDHRTELASPASTLSGGETFFVSLALALGLARTIQAENGGVSMDTLFIDEGFGTLSDDYLNDVVHVLRGISHNRDIGIISHVGALKDQISERIHVRRAGEDGESSLRVIA